MAEGLDDFDGLMLRLLGVSKAERARALDDYLASALSRPGDKGEVLRRLGELGCTAMPWAEGVLIVMDEGPSQDMAQGVHLAWGRKTSESAQADLERLEELLVACLIRVRGKLKEAGGQL